MQLVRDDPVLQLHFEQRGADLTSEEFVTLGNKLGLDFSWDELQSAFRLDWKMRRVRYIGETRLQALKGGLAEYRD